MGTHQVSLAALADILASFEDLPRPSQLHLLEFFEKRKIGREENPYSLLAIAQMLTDTARYVTGASAFASRLVRAADKLGVAPQVWAQYPNLRRGGQIVAKGAKGKKSVREEEQDELDELIDDGEEEGEEEPGEDELEEIEEGEEEEEEEEEQPKRRAKTRAKARKAAPAKKPSANGRSRSEDEDVDDGIDLLVEGLRELGGKATTSELRDKVYKRAKKAGHPWAAPGEHASPRRPLQDHEGKRVKRVDKVTWAIAGKTAAAKNGRKAAAASKAKVKGKPKPSRKAAGRRRSR